MAKTCNDFLVSLQKYRQQLVVVIKKSSFRNNTHCEAKNMKMFFYPIYYYPGHT